MPMSFDGLAANTSGWSIGPRARGTGSIGCAARIQHSLPIGHYATATAEHREPYESRGSRTVLGAPEGESPSGDSSKAPFGPLPATSGLTRSTDIVRPARLVRFVPTGDVTPCD